MPIRGPERTDIATARLYFAGHVPRFPRILAVRLCQDAGSGCLSCRRKSVNLPRVTLDGQASRHSLTTALDLPRQSHRHRRALRGESGRAHTKPSASHRPSWPLALHALAGVSLDRCLENVWCCGLSTAKHLSPPPLTSGHKSATCAANPR